MAKVFKTMQNKIKTMQKQNSCLKLWEKATQNLVANFIAKNFGKTPTDVYWIGDIIGDTLAVNDYFFDTHQIVDFIRYNYSEKDVFSYYDYAISCAYKKTTPINIKNWRKLK